MTPVTASSHHPPPGKPRLRHRSTIDRRPPRARATPSIMPKTPRQRPARRQNPDPDRRSVAHYDGQCSPYPRRCPGKSP
jgi:hypothetical protein